MLLSRTTTGRLSFVPRLVQRDVVLRSNRWISTETPTNVVDRDVVIVGGGPAGLALASALGSSNVVRRNCSISLIEGGDLDKIKAWKPASGTFSNRVSSLTNASQQLLKSIGAWTFVDEKRTCEMEEIQAWDGLTGARITFSAEDLGLSALNTNMARLTENLNLQRGLLRHLDQYSEVQLLQKTKVSSITAGTGHSGHWPLINLDNGTVLRARLLIGADGFNSPVRNYASISSYGWSYDTQAIVATMVHPPRGSFEGPNTTSYQRFLPTGPIAFLPLSPTVSSLVWSTRPHIASALLKSDPDVLRMMINASFRLPFVSVKYLYDRILSAHSAGKTITSSELLEEVQWREKSHSIDQTSAYSSTTTRLLSNGIPPADSDEVPPLVTELQSGSIASFPLRYNHADSYIGEGAGSRTVLVGDAAHTVHPLAGQGLNLGLADVECLSRCIESSLSTGGDIGTYTSLLPYAQERYLANHTLMSTVDKLHKIYTTEAEPIVWARSVGVEVLNELDSLKAGMMVMAGGKSTGPDSSSNWATVLGTAAEGMAAATRGAKFAGDVLASTAASALNYRASKRSDNKL